MSPKQKALLSQLQIAVAGAIVLVFGLCWQALWLSIFGGCITAYGLLRFALVWKLMGTPEDLPDDLNQDGEKMFFEEDEEDEDDW